MVELIIMACGFATSGPSTCREFAVQFEGVSQFQCAVASQLARAQWAGDHPGYEIKKYRCQHTMRNGKA